MKTTIVQLQCDFCGYGGPYTWPEDFQTIDGVDLCRWCSQPPVSGLLECGPHRIDLSEQTWSCSCGEQYRRPLFVAPRVLAALPSVVRATAYIHSESAVRR